MIYVLIATLLWIQPGIRTEGDHRIGFFDSYNDCIIAGSQLDWTAAYYRLDGDGPVGRLIRWDCKAEVDPAGESR